MILEISEAQRDLLYEMCRGASQSMRGWRAHEYVDLKDLADRLEPKRAPAPVDPYPLDPETGLRPYRQGTVYSPTPKQVRLYQDLTDTCSKRVENPVEWRMHAWEWLATKATRQTIKDQIDWLKGQIGQ